MLYRFRQHLKKQWFNARCRRILSTPPIKPTKSRLTIMTMLCHADLIMYLIAIKSFYFHIGEGRIVILNDGTLTPKDIELLTYHVSPSEIVNTSELKSNKVPQYISWKKLLFISDRVKENYVIQLDSDTVTVGSIPEVVECVRENRSFILGTWKDQRVEPMRETCQRVKSSDIKHVQIVAEKNFDKLPNYHQLNYVRGCSGFDGFSIGSFSLSQIETFSSQMDRLIGSIWCNWGSEQTTSNYLIANTPGAMVLPYPKYAGFQLRTYDASVFLHFNGTHRFKKGVYVKTTRNFLEKSRSRSNSEDLQRS